MKSFRNFISEEVLPSVQVADGGLDIEKPAVRAAINAAIAGVVSQPAVTPYVVFNRLSKLLAQYHIVLPKRFLEGDKGVEVFEVKQFGHKMGMTDSGEFVNQVPSTHYLFLQYGIITPMGVTYAKPIVGGMFRVTARLVDKEELDKLLDMAEITMAEEAECQQLAAKAHAPKEEMHDVTSDPKKKGNKKAVADSEKGLDEEQIDELYGTGSLSALAKGHKKAMNAALAADKTKIGTDQRGRSFAYDHDKKSEAAAEYHAGSARRAQVLKKKADIQSGDRDVVRGNAEKRMDNTLKYLRKYTRKEKSKMEESRIDEERKRTASVADAFMKGQKANQRTLRTDGKSVTYHGNTIAKHEGDEVHVTTAGHSHSPSTRGHINGILSRLGSEKLSVKKGQLHHGKNPVDHDAWIKVKKPTVSEEQVEEGTVTGPRSFKGSADRKRKAVQMALGRKNKDHPDWNPRTNPQYSALTLGRQLQKQGVKEETLDETRMPASVIKSKQKIAAMTPEEKAKKFAGKSEEQLKSMARRHGYGKDSNEYSKHVKEETLDEKAPPGREKQVLALKKKFPKGSGSPFAIAWSSYKKSKGE